MTRSKFRNVYDQYKLSVISLLATASILSFLQIRLDNPMLLAERFWENAGWIEIAIVSFYASFLTYKMQDVESARIWRIRSWSLFSMVFFTQLIIGLFGYDIFLMTGKLHLPVPAMILCGPIYRGQISFMTILFLSTVVLTGPAWCSHLCYFGAIDSWVSGSKRKLVTLKHKYIWKHTLLVLIILVTLLLRIFKIDTLWALILGISFGVIGIIVILTKSFQKRLMVHCIAYCPIGTIVNYLRFVSPFRIEIKKSCTFCLACSSKCKYDALEMKNIQNKKPGITCTLCGDCLAACDINAIQYSFFSIKGERVRNIYLIFTVVLHASFLALARI